MNEARDYYMGDEIAAVRALHAEVLAQPHGAMRIDEMLSIQADNIVRGHQQGNSAVVFHLACWCPGLISQSADSILNGPLSIVQARTAMAREYGYAAWDKVPENSYVDTRFEAAVDLLVHGRYSELQQMLSDYTSLASDVSAFGHRSTLLHYLGANGLETHRQVSPYNAAAMATLLLEHGADLDAQANIYGGSCALDLITTSLHPRKAGVTGVLADVLIGHSKG